MKDSRLSLKGKHSMPRKVIPKQIREQIYAKYNGHCAYCGMKLEYKDMQVDHINPHYLGGIDEIENYMPSCRACNFYKSTFSINQFRENIEKKLINKLHNDFNYKMLLKYGLIKEDFKPIKFYFEGENNIK